MLEIHKSLLKAPVEFGSQLVQGGGVNNEFSLFRVGEKIFGVVQEADVQRGESKAIEGARELVIEKLGVETVPDVFPIFDHFGIGTPGLFPGLGVLQIFPLNVADFGDDDHVVASHFLLGK